MKDDDWYSPSRRGESELPSGSVVLVEEPRHVKAQMIVEQIRLQADLGGVQGFDAERDFLLRNERSQVDTAATEAG